MRTTRISAFVLWKTKINIKKSGLRTIIWKNTAIARIASTKDIAVNAIEAPGMNQKKTDMKQQIKHLINGMKHVVRKEDDPKYKDAQEASSHIGYAGTSRKKRDTVANVVNLQNQHGMVVKFCDKEWNLQRYNSDSGYTWTWWCDLDEETAGRFVDTQGRCKAYSLLIYADCTVAIQKYVRKNERCTWKSSTLQFIDESFITIL